VRRWLPGAVALVLLAAGGLIAGAAGEDSQCPRLRDAFTSMPVKMVSLESGQKKIALRVKLADTSERPPAGFQCATPQEIQRNLILFDFGEEILTQFHMQNVPAPLDIAFIKADGRIFAILRMEPGATALYGPMGPFRYALEARAGFFESQGIRQGSARLLMDR
jgi:hypothetical protein